MTSMSNQHQSSSIHTLATLAGIEYFTTQLPDRVVNRLESAGVPIGYWVMASPGITGEASRPVNVAEKLSDAVIGGWLQVFPSELLDIQDESEGDDQDGDDMGATYASMAQAVAQKTGTKAVEWVPLPSPAGKYIMAHPETKVVAHGSIGGNGTMQVSFLKDDDLQIPAGGDEAEDLLEDEAVAAITDEMFRKASSRPVVSEQLEVLQSVISCVLGYVTADVAIEVFEEVFGHPPSSTPHMDNDEE